MNEHRLSADQVIATVRVALVCVVGVLQVGLGLRVLLRHEYETRALTVAAFAALACVTAGCAAWAARREPLPHAVVVAGTAVVLAASVASTLAMAPSEQFGPSDWASGLIGWHLLLLFLDRMALFCVIVAVHNGFGIAHFLADGVPDRAELGTAGTVVIGTAVVQLAAVVISRLLSHRAREAMALAAEQDRLSTRVLSVERWERGQRTAFAGHLGATLSLLADLADGLLDPREPETRRWAALADTQLRRLFAEDDDVPDPLVGEVSACVDVAERHGVDVSLAVSGSAVDVPEGVRRDLTGAVAAALAVTAKRARVSILRADGQVRVAVVGDARAGAAHHGSPEVHIECGTYGEYTRMEARWRRQS